MSRFKFIYEAIEGMDARSVVEVGVHRAERSQEFVRRMNGGAFYGFDLFQGMTEELKAHEISRPQMPLNGSKAMSLIHRANPLIAIELFVGDSKRTFTDFAKNPRHIDVFFIDGGHSLETTQSDIQNVLRLLGPKSVAFIDDYSEESDTIMTKRVVDEIDRSRFNVEILDSGDRASEAYGSVDLKLARITVNEQD